MKRLSHRSDRNLGFSVCIHGPLPAIQHHSPCYYLESNLRHMHGLPSI